MPRKRQEGRTTSPRYKIKMARLFFHPLLPAEEVLKLAEAITESRAAGYALYKSAWQIARGVLLGRVSSVLFGAYRSATMEFVRKVMLQKSMTTDEWIDKWSRQQLDPGLLREISDKLVPMAASPAGAEPQQKVS